MTLKAINETVSAELEAFHLNPVLRCQSRRVASFHLEKGGKQQSDVLRESREIRLRVISQLVEALVLGKYGSAFLERYLCKFSLHYQVCQRSPEELQRLYDGSTSALICVQKHSALQTENRTIN